MTLMEYLYAIRIVKVHEELLATDASIGEIFEAHGCTNYRVAMRTFKRKLWMYSQRGKKEIERERKIKSRNRPIFRSLLFVLKMKNACYDKCR